ncbi:hypothetical protein UCDDA912_g04821 [Diaporthe ampelina]|uniref:Uncharacterized protein n=1 Tax=Diaporthe ampelina TaxID=1214573 RepID=A0A0G2I5J4_9PEZI|nr:hypothetical protein UCDDA912_g04821 [Diaporthe ampelina]
MVQTSRCFDRFCSDMQAAVNELSQYDVQLYLDVTHTCAQLKNCMNIATRQSAMFINSEQGRADPIRNHIRRVMERLEELRRHRNRIADIYLTGMVYENPEVWQLQTTLEMHMSLLQYDVLRIVHVTKGEPRLSDDLEAAGHIPEASQPAPQED